MLITLSQRKGRNKNKAAVTYRVHYVRGKPTRISLYFIPKILEAINCTATSKVMVRYDTDRNFLFVTKAVSNEIDYSTVVLAPKQIRYLVRLTYKPFLPEESIDFPQDEIIIKRKGLVLQLNGKTTK